MRIILGSQSPRRKEILNFFTLPFIQIPSAFDETQVPYNGDPALYCTELSQKKALELCGRFPEDIILTADTVVYFNGNIYNKPENKEEAIGMLNRFSGQRQSVFTAVTVANAGTLHSLYEETKILFQPLTEEQIELYCKSCSFLDKAGAYSIQHAGSMLISQIEGCYYNVLGLPIHSVKKLLQIAGIDLWKHLKSF